MIKEDIGELHKLQFGPDFKWGVSTAAFQIEGAHDNHGKGPSIWDVFTERKGKIKHGDHARNACEFYRSYQNDISLVGQLNIPNFRFSLSWPRIMPTGQHRINNAGISYYDRIIDTLLEKGIDPWVTMYHWDLPHALELKGGWTNRDVVSWFSEFGFLCGNKFGDRVKNWIIMNEPSVFTGAGYFLGIHAPGKRGIGNYVRAIHHATLATASCARVIRDILPEATIGTTFSCTDIHPYSNSEKDIAAAARVDTLLNRAFIEPILGMGYPVSDLPVLKKIEKLMSADDEKKMAFDFDFIGVQCYAREVVKASIFVPYINARLVKAQHRNVPYTEMGWEVYPQSIYNLIKKFDSYKGIKKIIITENGSAFHDVVEGASVNDHERTKYLKEHLEEVLRAKSEGAKVEGYFIWTLTDNFEWAEGYHPRFGLVHVDFQTQKRTIKDSGHWYKNFLKN